MALVQYQPTLNAERLLLEALADALPWSDAVGAALRTLSQHAGTPEPHQDRSNGSGAPFADGNTAEQDAARRVGASGRSYGRGSGGGGDGSCKQGRGVGGGAPADPPSDAGGQAARLAVHRALATMAAVPGHLVGAAEDRCSAAAFTVSLAMASAAKGGLPPGILHLVSPYRAHLEHLRQLGKGGFGSVVAVRSRLDRRLMAVKAVSFRSDLPPWAPPEQLERRHAKLLREVQALAGLDGSPHVVRYYTAWIEPAWDKLGQQLRRSGAAREGAGADVAKASMQSVLQTLVTGPAPPVGTTPAAAMKHPAAAPRTSAKAPPHRRSNPARQDPAGRRAPRLHDPGAAGQDNGRDNDPGHGNGTSPTDAGRFCTIQELRGEEEGEGLDRRVRGLVGADAAGEAEAGAAVSRALTPACAPAQHLLQPQLQSQTQVRGPIVTLPPSSSEPTLQDCASSATGTAATDVSFTHTSAAPHAFHVAASTAVGAAAANERPQEDSTSHNMRNPLAAALASPALRTMVATHGSVPLDLTHGATAAPSGPAHLLPTVAATGAELMLSPQGADPTRSWRRRSTMSGDETSPSPGLPAYSPRSIPSPLPLAHLWPPPMPIPVQPRPQRRAVPLISTSLSSGSERLMGSSPQAGGSVTPNPGSVLSSSVESIRVPPGISRTDFCQPPPQPPPSQQPLGSTINRYKYHSSPFRNDNGASNAGATKRRSRKRGEWRSAQQGHCRRGASPRIANGDSSVEGGTSGSGRWSGRTPSDDNDNDNDNDNEQAGGAAAAHRISRDPSRTSPANHGRHSRVPSLGSGLGLLRPPSVPREAPEPDESLSWTFDRGADGPGDQPPTSPSIRDSGRSSSGQSSSSPSSPSPSSSGASSPSGSSPSVSASATATAATAAAGARTGRVGTYHARKISQASVHSWTFDRGDQQEDQADDAEEDEEGEQEDSAPPAKSGRRRGRTSQARQQGEGKGGGGGAGEGRLWARPGRLGRRSSGAEGVFRMDPTTASSTPSTGDTSRSGDKEGRARGRGGGAGRGRKGPGRSSNAGSRIRRSRDVSGSSSSSRSNSGGSQSGSSSSINTSGSGSDSSYSSSGSNSYTSSGSGGGSGSDTNPPIWPRQQAALPAPRHRRSHRRTQPTDPARKDPGDPAGPRLGACELAVLSGIRRWPYTLYISMELVVGPTLTRWLQLRAERLAGFTHPPEPSLERSLFRQIVTGLAHIHAAGIIHRDLKPANIFLVPLVVVGLDGQHQQHPHPRQPPQPQPYAQGPRLHSEPERYRQADRGDGGGGDGDGDTGGGWAPGPAGAPESYLVKIGDFGLAAPHTDPNIILGAAASLATSSSSEGPLGTPTAAAAAASAGASGSSRTRPGGRFNRPVSLPLLLAGPRRSSDGSGGETPLPPQVTAAAAAAILGYGIGGSGGGELAMLRSASSSETPRTSGVGTASYSAPEQLRRPTEAHGRGDGGSDGGGVSYYGPEVDIYPLGLILMELFCIHGTGMERANAMRAAREGHLPASFLRTYPDEARLAEACLRPRPELRPTAAQILTLLDLMWGPREQGSRAPLEASAVDGAAGTAVGGAGSRRGEEGDVPYQGVARGDVAGRRQPSVVELRRGGGGAVGAVASGGDGAGGMAHRTSSGPLPWKRPAWPPPLPPPPAPAPAPLVRPGASAGPVGPCVAHPSGTPPRVPTGPRAGRASGAVARGKALPFVGEDSGGECAGETGAAVAAAVEPPPRKGRSHRRVVSEFVGSGAALTASPLAEGGDGWRSFTVGGSCGPPLLLEDVGTQTELTWVAESQPGPTRLPLTGPSLPPEFGSDPPLAGALARAAGPVGADTVGRPQSSAAGRTPGERPQTEAVGAATKEAWLHPPEVTSQVGNDGDGEGGGEGGSDDASVILSALQAAEAEAQRLRKLLARLPRVRREQAGGPGV